MKVNKKQTFILEISDTQNQSWQGKLEWVQGRKKESFRSVLELLRLLDSVVGKENEENHPEGGFTAGCSSVSQNKTKNKPDDSGT